MARPAPPRAARPAPARAALAVLALLALLAGCGGGTGPEPARSGVLITLDTTNPGALGPWGRRAGLTPALDALAAESLVFDEAYSVAPLTLPAHASMLTGLFPPRHGVRDNGLAPLSAAAETLAERARERGRETAAFVAAIVLGAPYGLAQGFDVWDEPRSVAPESRVHIPERSGAAVTAAAAAWLRARDPTRPFFLWAHYFDPHAPYEPAPEFRERAEAGARFPAYLGEIAQMDAGVGELLAVLAETHGLERTLVAVVADHGESLYRHGEPTHAIFVYRATMHVPLFLRFPDGRRAGERSRAVVSVADVFPTFVEGLALGAPGAVDGVSLWRGDPPADRGVYFESYSGFLSFGWSPLAGWADARAHYVHAPAPELFLASDPRQAENVVADHPELAAHARAEIARVAALPGLVAEERLAEDVRARVEALGYAGGGDPDAALPHPLEVAGLPDPKEHLDELAAFLDAALLAGVGKTREAIERLAAIVEEHPENALALEMLGEHLHDAGRFAESVEVLERMVALGREREAGLALLARALEGAECPAEALRVWERHAELWPGTSKARAARVRLLERLGRAAEAAALRAEERPAAR